MLYGGTYTLFAHTLPGLGIEVRFAKDDSAAALEALIDDDTSAVFCESIGNPAGNIPDLEAITTMAHRHGVPVIVDNTVATPVLMKPIDFGADIVVHSLTKYMGGHGTSIGGMIVDSGKFPWARHRSASDAEHAGTVLSRRGLHRCLWSGRPTLAGPARCHCEIPVRP